MIFLLLSIDQSKLSSFVREARKKLSVAVIAQKDDRPVRGSTVVDVDGHFGAGQRYVSLAGQDESTGLDHRRWR